MKTFIIGIAFAIIGGLYSNELYNLAPIFWDYVKGIIIFGLALIMVGLWALFILARQ